MKNKGIILGIITSAIFFSCGTKESGPWDNFKPLTEIDKHIAGYYDASLGQAANPKSGNPAVYIDFSDGIIQAYTGNKDNSEIIKAIGQKMVNPNIEWFSLGGSKITKLKYNSNELFNKVTVASQYKDIMAPIQEALKKITASNNDALLITDFEEYTSDGKEQFENYPKEYFKTWLKNGNSITFFYTDYHEKNAKAKNETDKHLYFTVFTHGKATENSLVSQVKDAIKGRGFNLKTFELNNDPFTVSNEYGGKDNTGIANQTFAKWVNFNLNGFADSKMAYEVIGVNKPWGEDLEKYVQNIIQKENGLFMNKLYLNALEQSCFKLGKLAVKVYDVSDDYEKFAQCSEAKNHTPVLTKNDKKDNVWDDKSKKDAIIKECYLDNKTDLKPEWIYKPAELSANEWPEIFSYDVEIFNGHLKNSPEKIELKTVFHPNYKIKNIKKESSLIRIDFVIDESTSNETNLSNDFKWLSLTKKDMSQTALFDAIRNTLQEPSLNPKGKILYSYYIKFANQNKSENK